jgi:hypothetical protein
MAAHPAPTWTTAMFTDRKGDWMQKLGIQRPLESPQRKSSRMLAHVTHISPLNIQLTVTTLHLGPLQFSVKMRTLSSLLYCKTMLKRRVAMTTTCRIPTFPCNAIIRISMCFHFGEYRQLLFCFRIHHGWWFCRVVCYCWYCDYVVEQSV